MKLVLSVLTFLLGANAHAGLMAEPFLGYFSGSTTATTNAGADSSSTMSGFNYGARLGYQFGSSFWLAGEYTGASGKDKGSSSENDIKRVSTGVVVGFKHMKNNFWAGYAMNDRLDVTIAPTDIYLSGTNMKIGFGYEAANHVSVNAELVIFNYKKFGNTTTELDLSSVYSKFNSSAAVFSISFPFGGGK